MNLIWALIIAGAYLLGSIPFGVLIARARGVNLMAEGSRNPGASNVTRLLGKRLGIFCFFLDMAKGVVPVIVAGVMFELLGDRPASSDPTVAVLTRAEMWLWLSVACAAVLGHMRSPWLGFRGGKGVATGFGAMAAMWEVLTFPALAAIVVWYGVLRLTRYVSVASVLAVISLPVGYLVSVLPREALEQPLRVSIDRLMVASPPLIVTMAMAALIVYLHRGNLARIRRGEEPKVRGITRSRSGASRSR